MLKKAVRKSLSHMFTCLYRAILCPKKPMSVSDLELGTFGWGIFVSSWTGIGTVTDPPPNDLIFNSGWRPQNRWIQQPQRDGTGWLADFLLVRLFACHTPFSPKAMTKHKFPSLVIHGSSSSPNFNPQFSPFPFLDPSVFLSASLTLWL